MASVVREGQKREPSLRRLPTPPAIADEAPEKPTPPAKPKPEKPTPSAKPKPAKTAPSTEGYNLLDLLGWKK